ncbi:hypothetical protein ACRRTK_012270 [Alexandromys fortis]
MQNTVLPTPNLTTLSVTPNGQFTPPHAQILEGPRSLKLASSPTLLPPELAPPPASAKTRRAEDPFIGCLGSEDSWQWSSQTTLCLEWGRGGVSPPPLNAHTMRRAVGFPALCLLLNLHAAGFDLVAQFAGERPDILLDGALSTAAATSKSWKPVFIYRHSQDIEKSLDIAQEAYKHSYHSPSEVQISKRHQIVNSAFPRPAYDPSLNLLAASGQDLEIENLPIPAANVIVMAIFSRPREKEILSSELSHIHRLKFRICFIPNKDPFLMLMSAVRHQLSQSEIDKYSVDE